MFYSIDILQKRGGRFGTIWLAATNEKVLQKRDYYAVNVAKTGNELRAFIAGQIAAERSGGHRPRFSLYLSSQLMYGVVLVYKKQTSYLLKETNRLVESLRGTNLYKRHSIDLATRSSIDAKRSRNNQTLPDLAHQIDPMLFGLFQDLNPIPPDQLPDVHCWPPFESVSDEPGDAVPRDAVPRDVVRQRSVLDSSKSSVLPIDDEHPSHHLQASRDEITLKDNLPLLSNSFLQNLEGEDLPIQDVVDFDALVEAGGMEDLFTTDVRPQKITILSVQEDRHDHTQNVMRPEDVAEPGRPKKQRKDTGILPEAAGADPAKAHNVAVRLELSPFIEPRPIPQPRPRHTRRLIVDTVMQIDSKIMINHMTNTQPTLRSSALQIPLFGNETVEQMFLRPGRKGILGKPLLRLWRTCCFACPTSHDEESLQSSEPTLGSLADLSNIVPLTPPLPPATPPRPHSEVRPEGASAMSIEQLRAGQSLMEEKSLLAEKSVLASEVSGIRSGRQSSNKSISMELSGHDTIVERAPGQESELEIVVELPELQESVHEPMEIVDINFNEALKRRG